MISRKEFDEAYGHWSRDEAIEAMYRLCQTIESIVMVGENRDVRAKTTRAILELLEVGR